MFSVVEDMEVNSQDTLCCGNLGRIEAMLVDAEEFGGDTEDARNLASRLIDRFEENSSLVLPGHPEPFPNVTFFDGLAGAAYTMLWVNNPEELPSPLLFE